jgi:hypothetical protein
LQKLSLLLVFFALTFMNPTIDLNNEITGRTHEIWYVWTERVLTAELEITETPSA